MSQDKEEYYDNGKLKKRCDANRCKEYYENGLIKADYQHRNNTLHGEHILYGLDSSRRVSNYSQGILNGESKLYYSDGKLKAKENYQDGVLKGTILVYDKSGALRKKSKVLTIRKQNIEIMHEILYDEKGDIVSDSNDIIEFSKNDEFEFGKEAFFEISYKKSRWNNFVSLTGSDDVYDQHFFIKDSTKVDTTSFFMSSNIRIPINTNKVGLNVLRGVLMNVDTVKVLDNKSAVVDHVDKYFEFTYNVK
ncbi:hypothetical protein [Reichenbachiella sp. MALMAid0571]|uniref:toxin-antitoxin system YwqK family antitoxin n=1 Tax=Reichenbachiella sp. MALMAid0571 TaxID=3143939 RepID=UPI0032DF10B5